MTTRAIVMHWIFKWNKRDVCLSTGMQGGVSIAVLLSQPPVVVGPSSYTYKSRLFFSWTCWNFSKNKGQRLKTKTKIAFCLFCLHLITHFYPNTLVSMAELPRSLPWNSILISSEYFMELLPETKINFYIFRKIVLI